jgi:hypothetical protein
LFAELRSCRLCHLDLASNYLVSSSLRSMSSDTAYSNLTYLDLSLNQIGDVGAQAVAESFRLSPLAYVKLEGCSIGSVGSKALFQALEDSSIYYLSLGANKLPPDLFTQSSIYEKVRNRCAVVLDDTSAALDAKIPASSF